MNSVGGVIGLPITNHFSPTTSHGRASGPAPLNPSIESGPIFGPMFKGGVEKSRQLPELYEAVAKMGGAGFLNAGSVSSTDGVDGLHLTAESERELGTAIAGKVKKMLK
jgi:lysophospholipase L1-like esterase